MVRRSERHKLSVVPTSIPPDDSDSSSDSELENFAKVLASQMNDLSSDSETDEEDRHSEGGSGSTSQRFVIDTKGVSGSAGTRLDAAVSNEESGESDESSDEESPAQESKPVTGKKNKIELTCRLQPDIDPQKLVYLETDIYSKAKTAASLMDKLLPDTNRELLKKTVLTADFERKDQLVPYHEKVRKMKKERQKEREKTKGGGWFDIPAPEMTDELRNDLMVLKMRGSLDPKRFYKGNDLKGLPKYFQMGRVVEAPVDFYHSRIPKKQRKRTLVDELLADSEFRQYNKRKYAEIQESRRNKGKGAFKHMKRLKKKKK